MSSSDGSLTNFVFNFTGIESPKDSPPDAYPKTLDLGPKINILKYAPKDVAVMVMKKLPPADLRELCKVKDRRIRELCQNFLLRKDYQMIWGGKVNPKKDIEEQEGFRFGGPGRVSSKIAILVENLKAQPREIQEMILMKTTPEYFISICSINDKKIKDICSNKAFLSKYGKLYEESLNRLTSFLTTSKKYLELKNLLNMFSEIVDPSYNQNEAIRMAYMYHDINSVKILMKDPRVNTSYHIQTLVENDRDDYDDILNLILDDKTRDIYKIINKIISLSDSDAFYIALSHPNVQKALQTASKEDIRELLASVKQSRYANNKYGYDAAERLSTYMKASLNRFFEK